MNLEGQVPVFFLYYFVAAAVILLFYIVVQRLRINRLEKENDKVTLHYQQHLAASRPKHTDLLAQSPFPACIIDRAGNITGANSLFLALIHKARVSNLPEFDHATMASLSSVIGMRGIHSQLVTIDDKGAEQLRQYMLVTWPLSVAGTEIGRVITLHEQTNVIRRKNHQAEFERELIECMRLLTHELSTSLETGLKDVSTVQVLNQELEALSNYLLNLHTPLRQQTGLNQSDIVPLVKNAIQEIRPLARKYNASCVATLPKSSGIRIESETFTLALTTILTAMLEFGGTKTGTIRFHIEQVGRKSLLSIGSDTIVLSEQELSGLFTFGALGRMHHTARNLHLRAAIARELCEKQGIILEATSHPDTGTIFTFLLPRHSLSA